MGPAAVDVLLERDLELEQLRASIRAAAEGRGRFVAVVGPAGIGKTRLLHAGRAIATEVGMTCLAARGGELEQDFPYAVARQLFEGHLRARRLSERRALFEGAAELAAGALGFDESTPAADSRFAVVHGLYWLCAALTEGSPLLLTVDDLHWADEPSLRFLAYLMRRVAELPVVVMTASRLATQEGHAQLVEAIVDDPDVVRIDLAALSGDAVRVLVAPMWEEPPTESFVDALTGASGGNPFLCLTAAGALVAQGVRADDEASRRLAELVGDDVAHAIRRRIGRLPEAAGLLAGALAVVGGPGSELRRAGALAGLSPDEAARARDVLVAQGILAATSSTEFTHPLVRTAIYDDVPLAERSRLHLEAARLLAREDAPPDHVALHLVLAEPRAEPWVVEELQAAAQSVMQRGEPGAAASYLRRALREPPGPRDRAAVLHELGVAQFRAGEVDEAAGDLAAALKTDTDPRRRVQTGRELGFALFQTGRFAEAVVVQGDAAEEAAPFDADMAGWLEAERHQSALMDPSLYRALGDRLDLDRDLGGHRGGERALLAAMATEGSLRIDPGAGAVATWARRALDQGLLADSTSSSSGIWMNAAVPLVFAGELEAAMSVADAMVDDAQRRGSPVAGARAYMVRSLANLHRGAILDAEADARWSCELGVEIGFPPARLAVGVLTAALVERAELDAAEAFLVEVGATAVIANRFVDNWILYGRAWLRTAQGRIDEAAADLIELTRRGDDAWRPWNPGIFGCRSALALVDLRSGRKREAMGLAEQELRLAETWGAPFGIGVATRTLGQVAGGDRGLELLADSVEVLASSGARLEHARALVELGAALRRVGRRTEARDPLAEGAEVADSCGATALTSHALEELRASGARPRRVARSGVNALTASELRVARLAAEGMTNRQIAQALFVTLRTVEVHLTHCYQKLGISSRLELAAALDE